MKTFLRHFEEKKMRNGVCCFLLSSVVCSQRSDPSCHAGVFRRSCWSCSRKRFQIPVKRQDVIQKLWGLFQIKSRSSGPAKEVLVCPDVLVTSCEIHVCLSRFPSLSLTPVKLPVRRSGTSFRRFTLLWKVRRSNLVKLKSVVSSREKHFSACSLVCFYLF